MTERYKDFTLEELFLEKRAFEDALIDKKREQSAFAARYGDGYWKDEDYTSMARHVESLSADLAEMDAELLRRSR